MTSSKRALWLACLDEKDGARLIEIAREHVKLAREAPEPWRPIHESLQDPFTVTRDIIKTRIELLRNERDAIIAKYEPGNNGVM